MLMILISGAYSGPHERRLLHDLMDQYNKVMITIFIIIPINIVTMVIMFSWSDLQ